MIFGQSCVSSADDGWFSAISAFRRPTMSAFRRFLHFVGRRQAFFIVFRVSSTDDERFSAISACRRPTTGVFYCFPRFVDRRRAFFRVFRASSADDERFFLRFLHFVGRRQVVFIVFMFRGTPRIRFSDFSSFGTPRKLVFQNIEASGLPDGSFSQKTTRRGIPKHCFSEFLPFGMPRSTIFPIFRSSLASETLFLAIFDEKLRATGCFSSHFARRLQAKRCFWQFSMKKHERRTVFYVFRVSSTDDEHFLPFSTNFL